MQKEYELGDDEEKKQMVEEFGELGFMSVDKVKSMAEDEAKEMFENFKKQRKEMRMKKQRERKQNGGKGGNSSKFDEHYVDYSDERLTDEDHEEYYMRGKQSKFAS